MENNIKSINTKLVSLCYIMWMCPGVEAYIKGKYPSAYRELKNTSVYLILEEHKVEYLKIYEDVKERVRKVELF